MATVYLVFALVIAVLAVIFALYNPAAVTISFFAWQVTGSLSLVLLITLAIGALIGLLVLAPTLVKGSLQSSGQRKRLAALEQEISDKKAAIDEHKATIERLQAKVADLLAAQATPSAPQAPKLPGDGQPKV
jgi:putative membrane protein